MNPSAAQELRAAFSICEQTAYFQWAYRGALPAPALELLAEVNAAHSREGAGQRARWFAEYERVGELLCQMVSADPKLLTYTPNTSFAMGMVANGLRWQKGDEILLPEGEFPANVYPWMALERFGVTTRVVKCKDDHPVSAEQLLGEIGAKTRLVAASHVSFHNGYRIDVAAIAKACRAAGVWSVIDAAQSFGWAEIDISAIGADFVTGVGRKFLCGLDGLGFAFLSERLNRELLVASPGPFSVKHHSEYLRHELDYREDAARLAGGGIASPQVFALGVGLELFQKAGGFAAIEARAMGLAALVRKAMPVVGNEWSHAEQSAVLKVPSSEDGIGERLARAGISVSERVGGMRMAIHAMNRVSDVERFILSVPAARF